MITPCRYAGWGAGQLRMEMDERASWHVAAASNNVYPREREIERERERERLRVESSQVTT